MKKSQRAEAVRKSVQFANRFLADPTIRAYKFKKMGKTPFTFYRATCDLFYRDLASETLKVPRKWAKAPETWVCGDFHPGNVGFFENAAGHVVIDLNDFDESYIAPFTFDLLRFGAAIFLLRKEVKFKLTKKEARETLRLFLEEYRDTLRTLVDSDKETVYNLTLESLDGFVRKKALSLMADPDLRSQLSNWTVVMGGKRRFWPAHKDLGPAGSWKEEINASWVQYRQSLVPEASMTESDKLEVDEFLKIKDLASRLKSGLGSLGVRKFYALVEGDEPGVQGDLLLELKEQLLPSMLNSVLREKQAEYKARFPSHGHRNVLANRVMLPLESHLIGWFETSMASFLVRPVAPHRDGYDGGDFTKEKHLRNFVGFAGKLLALAHSRSDVDASESFVEIDFEREALAFMKDTKKFKDRLIEISETYAEQVEEDWEHFRKLRKRGMLGLEKEFD